jgi:hypothetical protein
MPVDATSDEAKAFRLARDRVKLPPPVNSGVDRPARGEPRFKACGPIGVMLSEVPVSAVERELDRTIGRGIAAFMETLDRTSIAGLIEKTSAASAA